MKTKNFKAEKYQKGLKSSLRKIKKNKLKIIKNNHLLKNQKNKKIKTNKIYQKRKIYQTRKIIIPKKRNKKMKN